MTIEAAAGESLLPAGLSYVTDRMPGIRRVRRGHGFAYRDCSGRWLRDEREIRRIRALAIPPAYNAVWICPLPNGHLQATGRDARGRKQYRYHPQWREQRDDDKFGRLEAFGQALPRIRARVARELAGAGERKTPSREAVLAAVVRLLDTTFVRVGNDEYAQSNGSYGLTTLRNHHAGVRGSRLRLRFLGKGGVEHDVSVEDPRAAAIVRRCQELPGQELFGYVDEDGRVCCIDSAGVNDYLHAAAGERFTAKDFRTWHGSVQALELMRAALAAAEGGSVSVPAIVKEVARLLRNTPAVCRKSYIHPAVLAYGAEAPLRPCDGKRGLRAAEARLLGFLEEVRARPMPARPSRRAA